MPVFFGFFASESSGAKLGLIVNGRVPIILWGDAAQDVFAPFNRLAVVSGRGPTSSFALKYMHLSPSSLAFCVDTKSPASISSVSLAIKQGAPDAILAVGGGGVTDFVRMTASLLELPYFILPTSLATDALLGPLPIANGAALLAKGIGSLQAVLVDYEVLVKSPKRLFRAGVGDILSNLTACVDYEMASDFSPQSVEGIELASKAAEKLLSVPKWHDGDRVSEDFIDILLGAIIQSGEAMQRDGSSRPCSGAEHLISHALDRYFGGRSLHGEQVSVAARLTGAMQEGLGWKTRIRSQDLTEVMQGYGLPISFGDLGYGRDEILSSLKYAPHIRKRETVLSNFREPLSVLDQFL